MTPRTGHARLDAWIAEIAALTTPAAVAVCDGGPDEHARMRDLLVGQGIAVVPDVGRRPGSLLVRSDPSDVARTEQRTFIACRSPGDAGPTNNWLDPGELRRTMTGLFRGCMAGRTMYVVPFSMGPVGGPLSRIGVEITDSPYVVLSMRIMTRMGAPVLAALRQDTPIVPCLHSVGRPLPPGGRDAGWPCAPLESRYIAHFPEDRTVWSFGSGYGGNALLGKKSLALRLASVMARDEGWLAEHMLILALTDPRGRTWHIAAAFPSACGKTNLAMLQATLPGWSVRTLGDDIAWMRIGADGRLRAMNPEAGFFGVAPGTSAATNPHAAATIARDTVFTNCLLTADGDVWWEGMDGPPPAAGTDWQGRPWTPDCGRSGAHANARFTVPATRCPVLDPRWDDPEGVPIDAIVFGGRRPTTVPLVVEARSWRHGVFLGSSIGSETTAAAAGAVGEVRRDPFAMLPFCGYDMGGYFAHWLRLGERLAGAAPRIFMVNWFRKDAAGRWLWPGFGDNCRVLAWIAARCAGEAPADEAPVGRLPGPAGIDLSGLDPRPDLAALLRVDVPSWRAEVEGIAAFYRRFGDRMPQGLWAELDGLRARLG